jgi:hypothetical protein
MNFPRFMYNPLKYDASIASVSESTWPVEKQRVTEAKVESGRGALHTADHPHLLTVNDGLSSGAGRIFHGIGFGLLHRQRNRRDACIQGTPPCIRHLLRQRWKCCVAYHQLPY